MARSAENDLDQPGGALRRFGRWVAGLGPGAIPLGFAVLCLIGFGLPLILVLAIPSAPSTVWSPVEAEVVEVTPREVLKRDPDNRRERKVTEHLVVVRYTVDGVEYERSPGGTSEWRPHVGQRVTVYYDTSSPRDISRSSGAGDFVPWLLGSMGLGFVAIFGVTGLVLVRKGVSWRPAGSRPFPAAIRSGPARRLGQTPSATDWVDRVGPAKTDFDQYRPEADSSVQDSDGPDEPYREDDLR